MIELKSTRPAVVRSHRPVAPSSSSQSCPTQYQTGVWKSTSSWASAISTSP